MSELKLAQVLDSIDERTRRTIAAELKIDLKLLSLTLSSTSVDRSLRNRSRVARLTVAEQYIRQGRRIGDIASGRDWIAGEVDMGWRPLQDGRTVLFCGYAGPLLVSLGGSVSNVLGYPASEIQTGSYTATIREAVSGDGEPEQFWRDLETTARDVSAMPRPVRFLAQVLARYDPRDYPARPAVVLATPLYVEHAEDAEDPGTGRSAGASGEKAATVSPAPEPGPPPHEQESTVSLVSGKPRFIGPYEVLRRLGEGSMGIVYLVVDGDGRHLALKVIRPEYSRDAAFLRRFADEADSARRVQDPAVAHVVEAVTDTEAPYLVTEFVEGPTLREKVSRDGPLPLGNALDVGIGTATALAAVHHAGIIHRDLTPSNVILSGSGPKVIDFGVASSAVPGRDLKADGLRVGTPAYMSPEQIQREELTSATDIFSWAGTMVYATTGHQPFGRASRLGTLWEIIDDDPDLTGVPAPLRDIIAAALDKTPAARPSAEKIVRDLRAITTPAPTLARPEQSITREFSSPPRDMRKRRRRYWTITLVAATLIVAAAVAIPVLTVNQGGTPAESLISGLGKPGYVPYAMAFSPDGKSLATGGINLGSDSGAAYLWDAVSRKIDTLANPDSVAVNAIAYAPSGQTLATGDSSGNTTLWNTTTHKITATLTNPNTASVSAVAYTPSGQTLATGDGDGNTTLWNTTTDKTITTLTNPDSVAVNAIAYAPSGRTLATGDSSGNTTLWNTTTHKTITTLTNPGGKGVSAIAYAPSGQTLAIGDGDGDTYLWNTTTHKIAATLTNPGGKGVSAIAYAPSGQTLAIGDSDGNTYLWHLPVE